MHSRAFVATGFLSMFVFFFASPLTTANNGTTVGRGAGGGGSGSAEVITLRPDLAFHFVCSGLRHDDIDAKIEANLKTKGFEVLDVAKIQRQHGVRLLDTDLVALDSDSRLIEIMSVPRAVGRYSFGLYSRPPTSRAEELETSLLDFVTNDLKCDTSQVARDVNGDGREQKEFFESTIKSVQRLFREADQINGKQGN